MAETALGFVDTNDFRLEGIKAVHSNGNEIIKELIDVSTGVDENVFPCISND